jgi:hypothetical protein
MTAPWALPVKTKRIFMFKRKLLAAVMFGAAVVSSSLSPDAWAQSRRTKPAVETIEAATVPLTSPNFPGVALRSYSFTFNQLGVLNPFQLRGVDPIYSIPFSIPADEVVTAIKLKLDFSYSPSLLSQLSHLKVMLNEEVAQTIALPKEQAGTSLIREVSIDPRLVTDFNRLSLQFIGHYTLDCEDPFHSSLWLNVSNMSSVQFTVTPLSVVNDLALLPVPFFDRRDGRRLERPFVFSANPSTATLEAAGIVASWFGDMASYRGAWFPAHLNKLPNDNVVLFATSDDKPQGIINLPPINGPTITVAPHPNDERYKILYVMGRDAAELRTAATALGLGRIALAGQTVAVGKVDDLKKRKPYDAPRWIPSDRPVKFGEIATIEDLNVRGLSPDLVRLNLTTPPDLFAWRSPGAPFDLKFRYTPRPKQDKSNLNVLVNQNYITSFPLLAYPGSAAPDSSLSQWLAKLGPSEMLPVEEKFHLPINQLRARSQMQFHFSFDYPKEGACRDVVLDNVRAAIDPDSELDISQFPHYLKMPNLSAFANTGFPFTRMADLSETAVVLPESYSAGDIGTYLTLMGRMGESTGLPVYGVTVTKPSDIERQADKDILLVGGPSNQALLRDWAKSMPFSADGAFRMFSLSDWRHKLIPWYDAPRRNETPVANLTAQTLAKDAVLLGFESPLKSGRSVVAVTSDRTSGQAEMLNALMDADVVAKIQGGVSVVRGKDVEAYETAFSYFVGSLPPVMAIRWALASQSWVAALLIVLVAILLAGVLYTVLRRQALRRISGK